MAEALVFTTLRPLPRLMRDWLCQGPEGEPREPHHLADRFVEVSNGDCYYSCGEHETDYEDGDG